MGSSEVGTPSSPARTNRNASLELPSVKRTRLRRYQRKLPENGAKVCAGGLLALATFPQAHEHQDDNKQARHESQQKQRSQFVRPEPKIKRCQDRSDRRSQVVHGSLKAEGAAENRSRARFDDQRVTRRGADPFSNAVGAAADEQLPWKDDHSGERT
jgi:hypothetical protein